MKIENSDKVPTSHVGHIAWLVMATLLGSFLGYVVGVDWQNAKNTEDGAYVNTSTSKVTSTTSSTPSTTATPSPTVSDSTAGWKTYTNTAFHYTVKIPQNATYTELTTGDQSNLKTGYIVDFVINDLPIRVNASDNVRADKTLEALLETRNNTSVALFADNREVYDTISISGQRALQFHTSYPKLAANGLNTLLLGVSYYYQIETSGGTMEKPRLLTTAEKNTYDNFVSTFQITN